MSVEGRATLLMCLGKPWGPMHRVFVLMLVTALSGCTGVASTTEPSPVVVEDPLDYDYLDTGAGSHVHDYWGGAAELTLMQTRYSASNGPVYNMGQWTYQKLPDLEEGVVVPQGTGHLEVHVQAMDGEATIRGAGEVVAWTPAGDDMVVLGPVDTAFTYDVAPEQADLPHQSISGWDFWMRFEGEEGAFLFNGQIDARIVAVRGDDPLPVFEAHPDRWDGASEMLLFERTFTTAHVYYGPVFEGCSGTGGCAPDASPDEGTIVPADADHIDVIVRNVAGSPARMALRYHGADTDEWTLVAPIEDDGETRLYRIDVGSRGDSPYAHRSLWEFGFRPDVQVAAGEYHVAATVYKHPVVGPLPLG